MVLIIECIQSKVVPELRNLSPSPLEHGISAAEHSCQVYTVSIYSLIENFG
jgi:hypothetical protein